MLHQQQAMLQRIGKHINKLRTDRGLSLRQMGTRANVSPTYLSEVERGKRSLSIDFLLRMAHCFDIPVTAFLSDEEFPSGGPDKPA